MDSLYFPDIYGGLSGNSAITAISSDSSYNTAYGGYQENPLKVFCGYYDTSTSMSFTKVISIPTLTLTTVLTIKLQNYTLSIWIVTF